MNTNQIEKLIEYFKEFPGIGERQAKRFVYFLLHKNKTYIDSLGQTIVNLKNQISQCQSCFLFFQGENKNMCENCSDPKTDKSTLMIVEKDVDCESVKRSRNYSGLYFILGGLIPITTKETPNFIRIKELKSKVEKSLKNGELKEVIIALSINSQGEHTDSYIREVLNPLTKEYKLNIVSLGRGLSTGTELEYSDSETIKNALKNRS